MPKPLRRSVAPDPAPRKEPAYPYYHWKKCLEVAEAVQALGGGRADVNKSMLAHQLNMSEDSSSLSQLVASAKTFGMIQGWGTYRLTDNGQRYFFPTGPGEDRRAALAFLTTPAAYRLLVERFDGNTLPPDKTLSHILLRDAGVPESWRDRAVSIFKDAVAQLGLLDPGGRLRYKVASHAGEAQSTEAKSDVTIGLSPLKATGTFSPPTVTAAPADTSPATPTGSLNVWVFSEGGGTVRLETPDPMPMPLWARLKRYVEVLKPGGPEKGAGDDSK